MIEVDRNYTNRSRKLSDRSLPLVGATQKIIVGLKEYLPLTLRQIYYQLVAHEVIENSVSSYKRLGSILTKARLEGLVPWEVIEDRARDTLWSGGYGMIGDFIRHETEYYLEGYRRDLLNMQKVAPELWIEKDALSRICHRAALDYCVPVIVAKGFSSISYMYQCKRRIDANLENGQTTVILYFGDFDPSGWEMPEAMLETLHGDMGVDEEDVKLYRCALNDDQIDDMKLPHSPEALKKTDTRYKKFMHRFGRRAVELDAIPPAELETLVSESIESILDMKMFRMQKARWRKEEKVAAELKEDVSDLVTKWMDDNFKSPPNMMGR